MTLVASAPVRAEEWFVAPGGDDAAAGTRLEPFQTLERAQDAAEPGDTVWVRGGEYRFEGTAQTVGVAFTKSGSAGQPIRYFAEPGEQPVFDFFGLTPQARVTGLDVHCNFIHLKGLTVRGVQQEVVGDSWGVRVRGDDNVLEQLEVHGCEAPGVFITSGARNLVSNSDSHDNYDPLEGGGNADGFGCHSSGGDNLLSGCRAWNNSDDGFDFINAAGSCTVEKSWAFDNGFQPGTRTAAGNGAGFKAGGFGSPPVIPASGVPRHAVRFSVAFGNRTQGFYANHHPGGLDFVHDVAFDNPSAFDMLVEGGDSTHLIVNGVAFGTGNGLVRFSGGTDSHNSWSLPVQASAEDFVSSAASAASAPRNADGSLPGAFMRLAEGSDLIDQGQDLGTPFHGAAPDLGAFEWGEVAADAGADAGGADAGADAGLDGTVMDPDAALSGAGAGAATGGGGTAATGRQAQPATGGAGGAIRDDAPARACACRVAGAPPSRRPPWPLALVLAPLLARAWRRCSLW